MKIFIGGGLALLLGVILLIFWWWDFLTMVKGLIPIILLVGGGFAAYSGYDEIKEKMTGEPKKVEPSFEMKPEETSAATPEFSPGAAQEKKPEKPKAPRARRKRAPRKKEA
ncbi:MAG: hypothetical protein KAJ09_10155 [Deltaproteobacteria bacterium]|nr:hypothetical protein [Deltaproteobacteria bacterium]